MRFRIFGCNNYVKYGMGIHVLSLSLSLSLYIYLSRPPSRLQPCISIHYSLFRNRNPGICRNISLHSECLIGSLNLQKWQYYNQVLTHSFMQSSQRRLQLEATTRDLHLALSVATRGAVSMTRPLIFRYLRTLRLQVSFCRHQFRFPWCIQRRATLCSKLRRTWPSRLFG